MDAEQAHRDTRISIDITTPVNRREDVTAHRHNTSPQWKTPILRTVPET